MSEQLDTDAPVTHRSDQWTPRLPVEETPVMPWTYDQTDPALMLFTAAVQRFNLRFPMGSRVLELGCAESDWLERMHLMDRSLDLVGVDARAQARHPYGFTLLEGSAMNPDLFPPNSFDWVVMLGALEHFGLGFYGDPVNENGDTRAMENVARWLRPGGFVYFDVPCQPTYRVSENRHFRSYAAARSSGWQYPPNGEPYVMTKDWVPGTVSERLIERTGLQEINRGYSLPEPHAGTWCHEPTEDRVPYWFVAVLAQKVAR